MSSSWVLTGLTLFLSATLAGASPSGAPSSSERPTEAFRAEHAQLRAKLAEVADSLRELGNEPKQRRIARMKQIVAFFTEHLVPHAAWEEAKLYPAVDRRAGTGEPFTATMRYEHRVIERWIHELADLAAKRDPDPVAFVRRADNLLGLLVAHFEEEEAVLLPILDRTMTRADFERELGEGHAH